MSIKPSPGSVVQINGKLYTVLEGPTRRADGGLMLVRCNADQGGYWAKSKTWNNGCGPWKIDGPVIGDRP